MLMYPLSNPSPPDVVFVPAVFTLLESQEGETINISRGEKQWDPHQSKAAALSEDTAGLVTWSSLGFSVKRNVLVSRFK